MTLQLSKKFKKQTFTKQTDRLVTQVNKYMYIWMALYIQAN